MGKLSAQTAMAAIDEVVRSETGGGFGCYGVNHGDYLTFTIYRRWIGKDGLMFHQGFSLRVDDLTSLRVATELTDAMEQINEAALKKWAKDKNGRWVADE